MHCSFCIRKFTTNCIHHLCFPTWVCLVFGIWIAFSWTAAWTLLLVNLLLVTAILCRRYIEGTDPEWQRLTAGKVVWSCYDSFDSKSSVIILVATNNMIECKVNDKVDQAACGWLSALLDHWTPSWRYIYIVLVFVLWCPALSSSSSASVTAVIWEPLNVHLNFLVRV